MNAISAGSLLPVQRARLDDQVLVSHGTKRLKLSSHFSVNREGRETYNFADDCASVVLADDFDAHEAWGRVRHDGGGDGDGSEDEEEEEGVLHDEWMI